MNNYSSTTRRYLARRRKKNFESPEEEMHKTCDLTTQSTFQTKKKGAICVTVADECKNQGSPGRSEVAERVTQLVLLLEQLTHIDVVNSRSSTLFSTQLIFVSCRWTWSCRGEHVS